MPKLSEREIAEGIALGECFTATIEDGSFTLKIESWIPCLLTAIHDGHRFREELESRCLLSAKERAYEEDPHTGALISSMPITLVAHDSRYEYDLNRPLSQAIHVEAWGRKVWKRALSSSHRERSLAKYRAFYRTIDRLVEALENRFGASLVFDVHSYNYRRWDRDTPTFNLGTSQIDRGRFSSILKDFENRLARLRIDGHQVRVARDEVFQGRGHLISHVNARHQNCLVVPTEVKKVFMDEESGQLHPLVLSSISRGLKKAFSETAAIFVRKHTSRRRARASDMLRVGVERSLIEIDQELYAMASRIETLIYVSPVNVSRVRRRFMRGAKLPAFQYRPLDVDPYTFRADLYRLPLQRISDPEIRQLYRDTVDALALKIDLLTSVGTDRFLYNSLRYYGEPDEQDLLNAKFLLHGYVATQKGGERVSAADAVSRMRRYAQDSGMPCKVELSRSLTANALVNNSRRALLLRADVEMSESAFQALVHHELGIHMATTLNALAQPLKIFSLGLPMNTMTQEGLAILNEYLAGWLSMERLRTLALRVIAVSEMLRGGDLLETTDLLARKYNASRELAFDVSARVFRGGGFTKDYVYLRGFREVHNLWKSRSSLRNLMVGKTSVPWLPLIDELVERQLVTPPEYTPESFAAPEKPDPVIRFLVESLHPAGETAGSVTSGGDSENTGSEKGRG